MLVRQELLTGIRGAVHNTSKWPSRTTTPPIASRLSGTNVLCRTCHKPTTSPVSGKRFIYANTIARAQKLTYLAQMSSADGQSDCAKLLTTRCKNISVTVLIEHFVESEEHEVPVKNYTGCSEYRSRPETVTDAAECLSTSRVRTKTTFKKLMTVLFNYNANVRP